MGRIGGLAAIVFALAAAAPVANATVLFRLPKPSGVQMEWYRWHPGAVELRGQATAFGTTAVVGLDSMRDLTALRRSYSFARVQAMPELQAKQVRRGRRNCACFFPRRRTTDASAMSRRPARRGGC